jgi:hypothetical protein
MRPVAVSVECPEPTHEVPVEARLDEEGTPLVEHPLEPLAGDTRAGEWWMTEADEPGIAAGSTLSQGVTIEDRDPGASLLEIPRTRQSEDPCTDHENVSWLRTHELVTIRS